MTKKNSHKKNETETIFIGVSWPYANGTLHLGHLAGQNIVCDVFARYHRLKGNEVLMVSGSDCHGAPVVFKAEELGVDPAEYAEKSHQNILKIFERLSLIYENYTTTTTDLHKDIVQNIFLVLKENGYLKAQKSKQYFDPNVERFLPDRYVRGTCPECGADNARGDECPECGEFLSPEDLVDPYSTLSDAKPELRETEHFYLDLSKAQPELEKFLENKDHWRKHVLAFTKGWLKQGLEPRAITRDMDYGIEVPVEGWEGKVIYVWFEAVIGYLSAAIEWAAGLGEGRESEWENFWKNPDAKHYYFIAGGNVPFHTIIWPAELIAYNEKFGDDEQWADYRLAGEGKREPLQLPYNVPSNKMLTSKGKKMSKGDDRGVTIDYVLDNFSSDLIRYFFVRYAPENHDREFTWKDFIEANNAELVGNLGNFVNRVLTFIDTKFDGVVPEGELDADVEAQVSGAFERVGGHIEACEFVKASEALLGLGDFANKYFNDREPWVDLKDDPARAAETLFNCTQLVNVLRILVKPFTPNAAEKLRELLNLPEEYDANIELVETGEVTKLVDTWVAGEIEAGHKINKPEVLFEKLEYTDELRAEDEAGDEPEFQPGEKIVVGKILELKGHPNSDTNQIAIIDVGEKSDKPLQIVCGAKNIKVGDLVPVALPGAEVLGPKGNRMKIEERKLQGVKSEGMLCSPAELGEGKEDEEIMIVNEASEIGQVFAKL